MDFQSIIIESPRAFIFMEENKDNLNKDNKTSLPNSDKMDWRPVLVFYAKTTAWIVFPLVLGVLAASYVGKSEGSQTLFLALIMLGFGVTCFGIYREIKNYKKSLDIPSIKEVEDKLKNVSKPDTK